MTDPEGVTLLDAEGGTSGPGVPSVAPVDGGAGGGWYDVGTDETKDGGGAKVDIPPAVLAAVRAQLTADVNKAVSAMLGDHADSFLTAQGRSNMVRNSYYAVKAEAMISGFTRHLFTSAVMEITLIILGILFYLGDADNSASHFVFMFVLHLLRPWGVLWVLNKLPILDDFVEALPKGPAAMQRAKEVAMESMIELTRPILAVMFLTGCCLFLDVLAVFIRLWTFHHIPLDEVAPSILTLLMAMIFCYIDFSAVLWFWSMKYNLPKKVFASMTDFVGTKAVRTSAELYHGASSMLAGRNAGTAVPGGDSMA